MNRLTGALRIEGYAVVSEDDRIADVAGDMPPSLKSDAEWDFFQAGLDAADVTVLGRRSHDVTPNPKQRRRLVMSKAPRPPCSGTMPQTVAWNPDRMALVDALASFGRPVAHLAVAGGQGIFDHFLQGPHRYSAFHLSRMRGVSLPGGIAVFGDIGRMGLSADTVLQRAGYVPGPLRQLDRLAHVVTWTPHLPVTGQAS